MYPTKNDTIGVCTSTLLQCPYQQYYNQDDDNYNNNNAYYNQNKKD